MANNICPVSGKAMFRTRAPAERILRMMNRKTHSEQGSVYLCQHCHHYHITHWGYESQEIMDKMEQRQKLSKKVLRSQRNRQKLPWHPPIPLRTEIRSLKQFFKNPEETMTKEEKIKIWESEPVREARFKMEISYILADVINSLLLDAVFVLGKNALHFNGEEKRKWNMLFSQAKLMKAASKQAAKAVYEADLVDEACQESDLMTDLILTIAQRVNDMDRDTMEQTYKLMKATIIKNFKNLYTEHKTRI